MAFVFFWDDPDERQALSESLRLWPDPTDAPDVPADRILWEFHRNPQSFQPKELALQIHSNVNCRRAIDRLLVQMKRHPLQELGVWPSDGRAVKETLPTATINKLREVFQKYPTRPSDKEEITHSKKVWSISQFDRPDISCGALFAFRRKDSCFTTANVLLKNLQPDAVYEIHDFDSASTWTVKGSELMEKGIHIEMPEPRSSRLFSYKKI